MSGSLYQLALEKVMDDEKLVQAEEMEVLVAKRNTITQALSEMLDGAEVVAVITEEGTIEIDDVTFTADYSPDTNTMTEGWIIKAEITCADCGEVLNYKTIYNAEDIVDVYRSKKVCYTCLMKECTVPRWSFWGWLSALFNH
jgi:hypothetical protein